MIAKIDEQRLREKIAEEIRRSFMPVCRCKECGTLETGYLIQDILDAIRGGK